MSERKERPILFNGAMVRAILEGRKTQTRRVVKPKRGGDCNESMWLQALRNVVEWREQDGRWYGLMGYRTLAFAVCPYGKVGDRLWVRETWQGPLLSTAGDYHKHNIGGMKALQYPEHCVYRATDTLNAVDDDDRELCWRPSIHMPRWASRILLEITDVRVERLNDISVADALAEGIEKTKQPGTGVDLYLNYRTYAFGTGKAIDSYRSLWESINGQGSWDENPWVWVVEFKRLP